MEQFKDGNEFLKKVHPLAFDIKNKNYLINGGNYIFPERGRVLTKPQIESYIRNVQEAELAAAERIIADIEKGQTAYKPKQGILEKIGLVHTC